MERDFLWSFFPFVPWETTQGVSGVMLMDWGGGGSRPLLLLFVLIFFIFPSLSLFTLSRWFF